MHKLTSRISRALMEGMAFSFGFHQFYLPSSSLKINLHIEVKTDHKQSTLWINHKPVVKVWVGNTQTTCEVNWPESRTSQIFVQQVLKVSNKSGNLKCNHPPI